MHIKDGKSLNCGGSESRVFFGKIRSGKSNFETKATFVNLQSNKITQWIAKVCEKNFNFFDFLLAKLLAELISEEI